MFSLIYEHYEKKLKNELWMCHKNMGLSMDEIYNMTIMDRKMYISIHNKSVEKDLENMKARAKSKK